MILCGFDSNFFSKLLTSGHGFGKRSRNPVGVDDGFLVDVHTRHEVDAGRGVADERVSVPNHGVFVGVEVLSARLFCLELLVEGLGLTGDEGLVAIVKLFLYEFFLWHGGSKLIDWSEEQRRYPVRRRGGKDKSVTRTMP